MSFEGNVRRKSQENEYHDLTSFEFGDQEGKVKNTSDSGVKQLSTSRNFLSNIFRKLSVVHAQRKDSLKNNEEKVTKQVQIQSQSKESLKNKVQVSLKVQELPQLLGIFYNKGLVPLFDVLYSNRYSFNLRVQLSRLEIKEKLDSSVSPLNEVDEEKNVEINGYINPDVIVRQCLTWFIYKIKQNQIASLDKKLRVRQIYLGDNDLLSLNKIRYILKTYPLEFQNTTKEVSYIYPNTIKTLKGDPALSLQQDLLDMISGHFQEIIMKNTLHQRWICDVVDQSSKLQFFKDDKVLNSFLNFLDSPLRSPETRTMVDLLSEYENTFKTCGDIETAGENIFAFLPDLNLKETARDNLKENVQKCGYFKNTFDEIYQTVMLLNIENYLSTTAQDPFWFSPEFCLLCSNKSCPLFETSLVKTIKNQKDL